MRISNFEVSRNNQSTKVLLDLTGHLTSSNAISFKEELLSVIDNTKVDCYVDISNIHSMDLTGVNALAVAHCRSQELGKELVIVSSATNPAEELLHLTRFIDVFHFQRA